MNSVSLLALLLQGKAVAAWAEHQQHRQADTVNLHVTSL